MSKYFLGKFMNILITINKYYWNYDVHTTCLCLSEALIADMLSYTPRLRSLRSLNLGLLKSVPLRGCNSLLRLEDGDKPHPYIG